MPQRWIDLINEDQLLYLRQSVREIGLESRINELALLRFVTVLTELAQQTPFPTKAMILWQDGCPSILEARLPAEGSSPVWLAETKYWPGEGRVEFEIDGSHVILRVVGDNG